MVILLRTLDTLLFDTIQLVNSWLAGFNEKAIPTQAERKRLFLRQQLVAAHCLVKDLLSMVAEGMHVPPTRKAWLWESIDQAISTARQQDPQFDSVVIRIGPAAGSDKGSVPYYLPYEFNLDDLGYGTK